MNQAWRMIREPLDEDEDAGPGSATTPGRWDYLGGTLAIGAIIWSALALWLAGWI